MIISLNKQKTPLFWASAFLSALRITSLRAHMHNAISQSQKGAYSYSDT